MGLPVISYCIAAYRPNYTRLLVADLSRKTSVPYEILLWLNLEDPGFERFLERQLQRGVPLRIIGKTPENIGMAAYRELMRSARYDLIVQIDDDVVCVSPGIAEKAAGIMRRFPTVRQLTADVWQDEYTTGARPPMESYRAFRAEHGLYLGPIDGWFSVYHRSVLPLLPAPGRYLPLGGLIRAQLARRGLHGLLCTQFKVFHVIGPEYASVFGMIDFEIAKYRSLGRRDIVEWYEAARPNLPHKRDLAERVRRIRSCLGSF